MVDPCWYWMYKFRKTRFAMISNLTETLLAKNAPLSNFWKSWGKCPHTPVGYAKHQSGVEEKSTSSWNNPCHMLATGKRHTTGSQIPKVWIAPLLKNGCVEVPWCSKDAFLIFWLSVPSAYFVSPSHLHSEINKLPRIGQRCAHVTWENIDLLGGERTAVFQIIRKCHLLMLRSEPPLPSSTFARSMCSSSTPCIAAAEVHDFNLANVSKSKCIQTYPN